MAVGDIKGDEAIVMEVTAGDTITTGQVIYQETDGFWDAVADGAVGKFGIAMDDAVETGTLRAIIWGRGEVTVENTTTKGDIMMAGATGKVTPTDNGAVGENVGTMMEAAASLGTATLWVGLVG